MSQQQSPHANQALGHILTPFQGSQHIQPGWPAAKQALVPPAGFSTGEEPPRGETDFLDGATQTRVENWASQACAATLQQQGMTEGACETGPVHAITPDPDQPSSPAHSTTSQHLYQQQVQQHYLQQQQHLQQQHLQQQQQQLHQQQQQLQQQQAHPSAHQQSSLNPQLQSSDVSGFLGQIPGLGLPYGPQPPGSLHGPFVPGQGMSGQHQMPVFSEPMTPGAPLGQLSGMQPDMFGAPPQPKQKLHQQSSLVGTIPASAAQPDPRLSGGSNTSLPLPQQANFGMIGQLPEQYLKGRISAPVGQFPQLQQPSSFGFPNSYLGQPLNMPLASAGMSLQSGASMSNLSQFSVAQPYGMFPHGMHAASHVGSLDGSAYNVPDSASVMAQQRPAVQLAAPGPVVSLASLGTVTKVKMLCSSGGHFNKLADGWEYTGGETRLVSVSSDCHMQELQDALHRVSQTMRLDLSSSSASMSNTKYQLPGSTNMYVDLVDDEDVKLMFDEWADYLEAEGKKARTAKLHIYIDYQSSSKRTTADTVETGMPSGGLHGEQRSLDTISESASLDTPVARAPPPPTGAVGGSAEGPASHEESPHGQSSSADSASNVARPKNKIDLRSIASTMEIIDPRDITLVKFLGSGGYGEVHLGKWHSSEAAIKCLNPSLFFQGGEAGGNAAIEELIKEATLLSSMRHPNVVWVYGIVLGDVKPDCINDDDDFLDRDDGDAVELAAANARAPPTGGAGVVRPPAIVVEYMGQGSLKGALARKADIVQGALIRVLIAMDAAKGMEYLHQKRIVHFDLKSANLLLGYKDRRAICKVADFGLSKQKRDTYVSNVSSQRGTLPWIAPEIIKTPNAVTEKVDVYSFGVVLWELWTGREPYDGLNYHALLHQITTSKGLVRPPLPNSPEWEHDPLPELVPGYKGLIEACWDEAPLKRPAFRDIVNRLKVMAQLLRPPPKRRPSQIASQASAGSHSIPSQPGLASDASLQHNASDSAGVAEVLTKVSVLSPRGPSSRPPLGSPAKLGVLNMAEQQPAATQAAEQASDSKTDLPSSPPAEALAASELPQPEQKPEDDTSDSKPQVSEDYVSPFEQIQESPAEPQGKQGKSSEEQQSPFAGFS